MSSFRSKVEKCVYCGCETEVQVLMSTSSFGYCDLDLRPAPLRRFIVGSYIHECPNCGYVNNHLDVDVPACKEFIDTDKYLKYDGIPVSSSDARRFIRYALIGELIRDDERTIDGYVYAAWACDDSHENEVAVELRNRAAEIYLQKYNEGKLVGDIVLQMVDFLRRSRRFEDVISLFSNSDISLKTPLKKGIEFEVKASEKHDDTKYVFTDGWKIVKA